MELPSKIKVGLVSGLYYGSPGCRMGLWKLGFERLKADGTNYNILLGGLVDGKSLEAELRIRIKKDKEEASAKGIKAEDHATLRKKFIEEVAQILKENIPVIAGTHLHITTSGPYDGKIGAEIAVRLQALRRSDISYAGEGGMILELRQIGKDLGLCVPKKSIMMSSAYYDTPAQGILRNEKRGPGKLGDIVVVGCLASAVFAPGDSFKTVRRPYLVIPVLYKIVETRTAENQIGVAVLDFKNDNPQEATVKFHSFKDLTTNEWELVESPSDSTKNQLKLIEVLKKRHIPLTAGSLAEHTGLARKEVEEAMESLLKRRSGSSWPGLYYDDASKVYQFKQKWFVESLRYKEDRGELKSDRFIGFGCLHAGCKHTDMEFFRTRVPEHILANDVQYLIGAGDFIEGMKHDLLNMGEVYGAREYVFNYTVQEQLSGFLVGTVMYKVFQKRFEEMAKQKGIAKLSGKDLSAAIESCLLTFYYISGNHCDWVAPIGFNSLHTFREELRKFLVYQISKMLSGLGVACEDLFGIIQKKLIRMKMGEIFTTASGLTCAAMHPHMGGPSTTSISLQRMLDKCHLARVVFGANFHTAEGVSEWSYGPGQRVCLQFGTVKHESGFETTKLKQVDFGAGMLEVLTAKDRVQQTNVTFFTEKTPDLKTANHKVLDDFEAWMKISK
ncbi:MAG: hypothetical protein AAB389_00065 [Patescibacteria group bacterium]